MPSTIYCYVSPCMKNGRGIRSDLQQDLQFVLEELAEILVSESYQNFLFTGITLCKSPHCDIMATQPGTVQHSAPFDI